MYLAIISYKRTGLNGVYRRYKLGDDAIRLLHDIRTRSRNIPDGVQIFKVPMTFDLNKFKKMTAINREDYIHDHATIVYPSGNSPNVVNRPDTDPYRLSRLCCSLRLSHKHKIRNKTIKNEVCDLTLAHIYELLDKQKYRCALSGIMLDMVRGTAKSNPRMISVDRIDSKRGYVSDNIQIVCVAMNFMKMDYEIDTIKSFINEIRFPYGINHDNQGLKFSLCKRRANNGNVHYTIRGIRIINGKKIQVGMNLRIENESDWDKSRQRVHDHVHGAVGMNAIMDLTSTEFTRLCMEYNNVNTIKLKIREYTKNLRLST